MGRTNFFSTPCNPYLTNYGQNAYFWTFFEIIRVSASADTLKQKFKK